MTVTQVPFFLSSSSGRRPNAGGTKFTVECSPALSIPSDAASCTLHVHSASVPYTWNNVDSTNNSFVVTCTTPRGKRRSTAGVRPRKRARADVDSDEELTVAELRAQLDRNQKRAKIQEIRQQWIRDGMGGERGQKRKAS